MRTKLSLACGLVMVTSLIASGAPAKPGILKITQPDGTIIEATITGDEHSHYYTTTSGEILTEGQGGYLMRAGLTAEGEITVLSAPMGTATPTEDADALREAFALRRAERMKSATEIKRVAPARIPNDFPTTGEVKGLIIMAEFEDVKFSEKCTRELVDKKVNEKGYSDESTYGSVIDYFTTQSNGRFTPKFDIVGPVTLPHERKWYGGESERLDDLFRDACKGADTAGVDFTQYDVNNDYFVDFVFVIFAGHGQAQGGPEECVWPAMKDLSNAVYDYFDMMNLGVAACSCELKGGDGENLDGIGTICHEFSHILGLPDIYDSSYQGGHGMSHYDIMDVGAYNDNQVTPSGYTAMDKFTLGWIEPEVLEVSAKDVTLESFEKTHKAYFIVNPENNNEYFTLENRSADGWDKGLPGHGLVISYVNYEQKHWKSNTVNSPMAAVYEHVRIVAADNVWSTVGTNEAGDPFPGSSHVTAFNQDNDAWVWKTSHKTPTFTVTDINYSPEGTVTFSYNDLTSSIADITATPGETPEGVYDLSGRRMDASTLSPGLYIVVTPTSTTKRIVR